MGQEESQRNKKLSSSISTLKSCFRPL